jgi:hypothetical protein
VLNQLFGASGWSGTYGPKEAYALSPWMAPAIHAFAGTVAARTFRGDGGEEAYRESLASRSHRRPNKFLRMSEYQLLYYTAALWRYDGEVFWQLEYGNDRRRSLASAET